MSLLTLRRTPVVAGPPPGGDPEFVQWDNSANSTVTASAAFTPGNFLVFSGIGTTDATTITSLTGLGWTLAYQQRVGGWSSAQWTKIAGAAEPTTITVTEGLGTNEACGVAEFTNIGGTLDGSGFDADASTTFTVAPVSYTNPGPCLAVVSSIIAGTLSSFAYGAEGFTDLINGAWRHQVGYKVLPAGPSSQGVTASWVQARSHTDILAIYY